MMALNGLATGKNLKPFLCLVRNVYHDLFGTNVPIYDDGKIRLTKPNHVNRLRQAFPYYDQALLDGIFDQFKSHLDVHGADECKRLFEYYFSGVFREQGEFISSSKLYHFLDRRYLLSTLKNGFLYPSIVEYEEYQCLFKLFKGSAFIEKEGVLEDKPFLAEWRGSNQSLLALRNKGSSKAEIDQYLQDSAFVPAYTCLLSYINLILLCTPLITAHTAYPLRRMRLS
jgi:hypothetical protein